MPSVFPLFWAFSAFVYHLSLQMQFSSLSFVLGLLMLTTFFARAFSCAQQGRIQHTQHYTAVCIQSSGTSVTLPHASLSQVLLLDSSFPAYCCSGKVSNLLVWASGVIVRRCLHKVVNVSKTRGLLSNFELISHPLNLSFLLVSIRVAIPRNEALC